LITSLPKSIDLKLLGAIEQGKPDKLKKTDLPSETAKELPTQS
jgi:hypothetical protein